MNKRFPIPGFDGYTVTIEGVVYSRHGRPLSPYLDKDGYARVSLAIKHGKDAKRYKRGVHQIVALTFIGPCPDGHEARHLDGDNTNNWKHNLSYSDHLTNMRDRHKHGTVPRGENHWAAKLTEEQVQDIRTLVQVPHRRKSAFSDIQIAKSFGVSSSTIRLIRINRVWRNRNGN